MKGLNKADFYFGAFYSYLFTRKFNPALIDGTNDARQLSVCTDTDEYNLFTMYATTPAYSTKDRTRLRWNFFFTENLADMLVQSENLKKKNYVVFICGQEKLKESEIVVVPYAKVIACLGKDDVNENRTISITVSKHENYAYCYGTAVDKHNAYQVKRNIEEYLK